MGAFEKQTLMNFTNFRSDETGKSTKTSCRLSASTNKSIGAAEYLISKAELIGKKLKHTIGEGTDSKENPAELIKVSPQVG